MHLDYIGAGYMQMHESPTSEELLLLLLTFYTIKWVWHVIFTCLWATLI